KAFNVHTKVATFQKRHKSSFSDFEYLVSQPVSMSLPIGYDTSLLCEMNIVPDKFEWKFYPTDEPYNKAANIILSKASYRLIHEFRPNKKKSELLVPVKDELVAGDYQCLAYYGAFVVASVPWRITLARLGQSHPQKSVSVTVQAGNTVSWRCDVPESNPLAYVDYTKDDKYISPPDVGNRVKSMILPHVNVSESGVYKCSTTNTFEKRNLDSTLKLEVTHHAHEKAPFFISQPVSEHTATKGSTLFLECSAVGKPIPKVVWYKKSQSQLPAHRTEVIAGGLLIKNISSRDDGVYVCNHTNSHGSIFHEIMVKYREEPSLDCSINATDINQGENRDLECEVRGTPEPEISWFLNGFSVLNDSRIEAIGNKIYFRPIEKRHAGNLQIFARNIVQTVYSSIRIRVIPLPTSIDEIPTPLHNRPRHKPKKSRVTKRPSRQRAPKMIPPSKPVVSRVKDDTVVVRWNISNNNGLSILFFKVQYKEIPFANQTYTSNKGWNTANTDIAPNINAYEISDLKPDHFYKFRVAVVYSNNDSIMSQMSKKFHLRSIDFDKKNPLPVCLITHVETISHSSIKVYWNCPPFNVTIDGFYIHYLIATRAGDDYVVVTVEGSDVRSYVINYLHPETSYDVKLQSFNQKLASELSPMMKGRTGVSPVNPPTTTTPTPIITKGANIYVIIAGGVVGFALVVTGVILLFVCRKWQRNKLPDTQDKSNSIPNHIQADASDYMVESKTLSKANGCTLPGNKITITSNPLADTEKNPTVIEMRNLANNNVRQQPDSPSDTTLTNTSKDKHKRRNNIRESREDCSTDSNYV
uniref:Interference hedgehog n=1 Tax=Dendroctonus ponderosae TaxID=77166 RepID=A0AAR5NXY5_DENPD